MVYINILFLVMMVSKEMLVVTDNVANYCMMMTIDMGVVINDPCWLLLLLIMLMIAFMAMIHDYDKVIMIVMMYGECDC